VAISVFLILRKHFSVFLKLSQGEKKLARSLEKKFSIKLNINFFNKLAKGYQGWFWQGACMF